ncbi:MAG: DUF5671 domain-containing protein [Anaerolineales bacterium]
MQTIRRIYIYVVTLVSLETVIWGLIGLLRSISSPQIVGGTAERLAAPLAFVLVGIPVFYLHWNWAQRSATNQLEEALSWVRVLFFYFVMAFLLIPIIQNSLAFLSRTGMVVFGVDAWHALVGGRQTVTDNAIAVLVNMLAVLYFYPLLKKNWQAEEVANSGQAKISSLPNCFFDIRRLYRYLWLVYSLAISAFGVQQLILFVLLSPDALGVSATISLANGLALIVIGFPLWVYIDNMIQQSLRDEAESHSWMRLIFLFIVTLFALFALLYNIGSIGTVLFRRIFGEIFTSLRWMDLLRRPDSLLVPFYGIWWVYRPRLQDRIAIEPDASLRAGYLRFYRSLLAFAGYITLLIGISQLLSFLIDFRLNPQTSWENDLRKVLAAAIMMIGIGAPLWWSNWQKLNQEVEQRDRFGEQARRSLIRRGYVYLFILGGVLGVMFSSGALLYRLLMSLFGTSNPNLLLESLRNLRLLLIFSFVLVYHWRTLRIDLRKAATMQEMQRANYRVAILTKNPEQARLITEELTREAPGIMTSAISPAELHGEVLQNYPCVIVDDEALWESHLLEVLKDYTGERVIISHPKKGWYWSCGDERKPLAQVSEVAKWVHALADGRPLPQSTRYSAWGIIAYVLAGLFLLQILFGLIMTGISLIVD